MFFNYITKYFLFYVSKHYYSISIIGKLRQSVYNCSKYKNFATLFKCTVTSYYFINKASITKIYSSTVCVLMAL